MTFNLLLDLSLARQRRNNRNQRSHDFTIYFNPPTQLDREKKLQSGVEQTDHHELVQWYNIAEAYGNNKIKWRKNTGDWRTLTFPDGMYDYDGIKRFFAV